VDTKFGSSWGGWCSLEPSSAFGVGLWKYIRRGWRNFSCHTKFEVGDGPKIRFWHEQWCEDVAFKEAFSVLFSIANAKDASIVDHLRFFGGSNQ
jgi:hypothetical protein